MTSRASGGTVYWRAIGKKSDKSTEESEVRSIIIEAAQPIGSPDISPISKSSLPILSWLNNCNKKFKVWFGNDRSFTKKSVLSFSIADPLGNEGEFARHLTTSKWKAIRKLLGDVSGSTIYWKVESWDWIKRYPQTEVMSFVLTD